MMKPGDFRAGRYWEYPLVTSPLEPDQKVPRGRGANPCRELCLNHRHQTDGFDLAHVHVAIQLPIGSVYAPLLGYVGGHAAD